MTSTSRSRLPSRLLIAVGTYDGVLAGWDTDDAHRSAGGPDGGGMDDNELEKLAKNDGEFLKMSFAMAVHDGSVRAISVSSQHPQQRRAQDGGGGGGGKKRRNKKRRNKERSGEAEDTSDGKNDSLPPPVPGTLLSAGYDESLSVYSLPRRSQAGEFRSPPDLGSPTCSSFAPPPPSPVQSTHALVGLSSGKIAVYRKGDWTAEHVLSGHGSEHGGVNCLAVHPSGKMALSGGRGDGKLILWDLTRGRLGYVHKIPDLGRTRKGTVTDVVFSDDGGRYAFSTDSGKVTARDVATGEDLLDVALPSRANQVCFVGGPEGLFLAAACDDGSLPVLAVGGLSEDEEGTGAARRAIMAIEPVDGPVAGDARFKCIRPVRGGGEEGGAGDFLVVTANSGGVISVIDLEGAARMMLADDNEEGASDDDDEDGAGRPRRKDRGGSDSSSNSGDETPSDGEEEDDDEDAEVAAEFLDSVRVGTGARVTTLAVWSHYDPPPPPSDDDDDDHLPPDEEEEFPEEDIDVREAEPASDDDTDRAANKAKKWGDDGGGKKKRKREYPKSMDQRVVEMDDEAVERARDLVRNAKKRQKKKEEKKKKKEKKKKGGGDEEK